MVTMQVRSIAMLQRRLHPCQNGAVVAMLHAVEKTFLAAQPTQLVALTSPEACAASLQKVICCVHGPCETGETLDYPSMVSVPLCTKLETSDVNRGN